MRNVGGGGVWFRKQACKGLFYSLSAVVALPTCMVRNVGHFWLGCLGFNINYFCLAAVWFGGTEVSVVLSFGFNFLQFGPFYYYYFLSYIFVYYYFFG